MRRAHTSTAPTNEHHRGEAEAPHSRRVRRAQLHDALVSSAAQPAAASCASAFRGRTRLWARNSVYEFFDGTCCRISTASGVREAPEAGLVGMRIIGWLASEHGRVAITTEWLPGAVAILCRDSSTEAQDVAAALTSSSIRLDLQGGGPMTFDFARDDHDHDARHAVLAPAR